MATIDITEANFNEVIASNDIVVLDFWATWCGPCRGFAPIFEAAAAAHPDIVFGKIDTDREQALSGGFDIRSVPTLMVLREQILVVRESGALPAQSLAQVIDYVRGLNMDEVRAEVESAPAQG
jgi:thioredoxin